MPRLPADHRCAGGRNTSVTGASTGGSYATSAAAAAPAAGRHAIRTATRTRVAAKRDTLTPWRRRAHRGKRSPGPTLAAGSDSEKGLGQLAFGVRQTGPQLQDRLGMDLADPALGDAEHLADLGQRQTFVVVERQHDL